MIFRDVKRKGNDMALFLLGFVLGMVVASGALVAWSWHAMSPFA